MTPQAQTSERERLLGELGKAYEAIDELMAQHRADAEKIRALEAKLKQKCSQLSNMEEAWNGAKTYHEILQARIKAAIEVLAATQSPRSEAGEECDHEWGPMPLGNGERCAHCGATHDPNIDGGIER